MKKSNMIAIVVIVIFFFAANHLYKQYQERKGEEYVPNRFHSTVYDSPTSSPSGLLYMDGYLYITSPGDQAILKYDITTRQVVGTIPVPCFEAAGITFDGENFWVADYGRKTIHQISPEGEVLQSFKTPYSTPYGVAWDGSNLWVLDVYGLEVQPEQTGSAKDYPNARIYKFDLETGTASELFEAPIDHAGDITYRDGELLVAGERKVFQVDIRTKRTTSWYYAPDNLPRGITVKEDKIHFVSGMDVRNIWEVNLNEKMQVKDMRSQADVFAPLWLILITLALLFPVFLDEVIYRRKKG